MAENLHTTVSPNKTVNRSSTLEDTNENHQDQQSNIQQPNLQLNPNHQSRINGQITTNLRPLLDSPSQSPSRRTRSQLEENDDFIPVTYKNKRIRHDNANDKTFYDQQQHHQTTQPRYATRFQTRQQQQYHERNTVDKHASLNTSGNHHKHQHDQQEQPVSTAATRYALTRFPFSPFIIRFSSGNVKEKIISQELEKHFKDYHHTDIQIASIRRSITKCQQYDYDHLIYVKDSNSFCTLFNKHSWPQHLGGENFTFPSLPSFPPQLSLVIKNVDLRMNIIEFANDLKIIHPEIHNVIRLKNKYQNEIKLVKMEILSTKLRDEILKEGKLRANGLVFDVDEYLSPATVLICAKCRGIGHFRRQCTQPDETCNVCGINCPDLRQHQCSQVNKCIHCEGNHLSNSNKCPVIKNFRADLTKKILSYKSALIDNNNNNNNHKIIINDNNPNHNYTYNPTNYPQLPQSLHSSLTNNTSVLNKIDEILNSIVKMNESLEKIVKKQTDLEQFINDKNNYDNEQAKKINQLIINNSTSNEITIMNEKLIKKLILPTLELLAKFLYHANMKANGAEDADFRSQVETKRTLIELVLLGKKDCL